MSTRRIRNGKIEVYVKRKTRRLKKGLSKTVGTGGYWRPLKPKSRKRIVRKKAHKLRLVQDRYGRIQGTRSR